MTIVPEDHHPLHAGVMAKLADIVSGSPTPTPWYVIVATWPSALYLYLSSWLLLCEIAVALDFDVPRPKRADPFVPIQPQGFNASVVREYGRNGTRLPHRAAREHANEILPVVPEDRLHCGIVQKITDKQLGVAVVEIEWPHRRLDLIGWQALDPCIRRFHKLLGDARVCYIELAIAAQAAHSLSGSCSWASANVGSICSHV